MYKNLKIAGFLAISFVCIVHANIAYSQSSESILDYNMDTPWSDKVNVNLPWDLYPRPQMVRGEWSNLNGKWDYAISPINEKTIPKSFDGKIVVPFPVESALSEVQKMVGEENYLWYKREFEIPNIAKEEEILLHFGAVDWEATVFLNGKEVGSHKGGFDPFYFEISKFLKKGKQELLVRVWDPTDKETQPRGKQVSDPKGIWYTPVTGIWQTVWLEKVPKSRIELIKPTPNIDNGTVSVLFSTNSYPGQVVVKAEIIANDRVIDTKKTVHGANSTIGILDLDVPKPRLWSPKDPFLYDLKITISDTFGKMIDQVDSYVGMRKISLGKDGKGYTRILLNNLPLFQYGLLDQGWWPDGLYTPATEDAMIYDIEITKKMGFNMIRKHVKVESARWYYHCDKLGVLVWQDMPNGNYFSELRVEAWEKEDAKRTLESSIQFEKEYKAMIDNFYVFPSIVVWVPLNEGWGQYDTERLAHWTKVYDPSRLVDAPSGWADRGVGDMIDVHLYPGPGMASTEVNRASVLGEFGGLGLPVSNHLWWDKRNWGYLTYDTKDEFRKQYSEITSHLIGPISKGLSAAIYTQTTDVEGEVNGLLTYDRRVLKIDPEELSKMHEKLYKEYTDAFNLINFESSEREAWNFSSNEFSADWYKEGFEDQEWKSIDFPISSFDNPFINTYSDWDEDKFYLRKSFFSPVKLEKLFLTHFMPKSNSKIYLNGVLILDLKDEGGRKRNFTYLDISEFAHLIKPGDNLISIELSKQEKNASFDLGLFTTKEL